MDNRLYGLMRDARELVIENSIETDHGKQSYRGKQSDRGSSVNDIGTLTVHVDWSQLGNLKRGDHMAKYGKKASKKVEKAMHERKKGTLKSGRSGKKVTSKKQAIAIGLSEAREAGAKVPRKKSSSKKK